MKHLSLILLLLLSATSFVSACLTDVMTSITDDGNVEISYTLTSEDPQTTLPVFSISFTGELDGKKPFVLKTLYGDGASGLVLGAGNHTTVWNAAKDRKRDNPTIIKINIVAEEVTDEASYLCLDLKKFNMRYQNNPPDIKKNICKTKELWFRRIEPGSFVMGSPDEELGHYNNEAQHDVMLTKAFYIAIFEVTQKQFKAIAGYNNSESKGATKPVECVSYAMLRGSNNGSQWPVSYGVDDTCEFSMKKGKNEKKVEYPTFFFSLRNKTGNAIVFDLPTEAQWEYACRAGTTTALNNGKDLTDTENCSNMDEIGRYGCNGGFDKGPVAVGSYPPNAWGLYDMHGNVCEWCLDWYIYQLKPETDPVGANQGDHRVLKGGCFRNHARLCRSAFRYELFGKPDRACNYFGFRPVIVE